MSIALGYVQSHRAELGLTRADLSDVPPAPQLPRHHRRPPPLLHPADRRQAGPRQRADRHRQQGRPPADRGRLPHDDQDPRRQGGSLAGARRPPTPRSPRRATPPAAPPDGSDRQRRTASTSGLFVTGATAHPAWQAIVMSAKTPTMVVLDAQTGDLLQRRPLVNYEASDSTGRVFPFFPGARKGGKQVRVNFTKRHWLSRTARVLKGNNSHTYSDVNDNNHAVEERGGAAADRALVELPAQAVPPRLREVVLQQPVALLVEPEQAVLLAHQPRPERHAGLLLRQQLARPPAEGADRLHRGRGQLPDGQPRQGRQGRRPRQHPDRRRRQHRRRPSRRRPHRQRQHGHAARRPQPARCRCTCSTSRARRTRTATRSRRPTSATRPTPSTTSTPTACPTGWSSTSRVDPPSAASRPARWARRGATGTPWTTWSTTACSATGPRKADVAPVHLRRRRASTSTAPSRSTARSARRSGCATAAPPGHRGGYTYARLRQGRRRPRGARRRRDLGADPVEPARRARLEADRGPGHPGDGAGAVQPVVPRHAQRDPGRRHLALPAAGSAPQIWKVFANRGMGFFAGSLGGNDSRRARASRRRRPRSTCRPITGTVTDADSGQPVAGVAGDPGLPGLRRGQPDGGHRRADGTTRSPASRSAATPSCRVFGAGLLRRAGGHRRRQRRHGRLRVHQGPRGPGGRRHRSHSPTGAVVPGLRPAAGGRPEPGHRLEHQHRPGHQRGPQRRLPPQEHRGRPGRGVRRHRASGSTRRPPAATAPAPRPAATRSRRRPTATAWTPGHERHVHQRRRRPAQPLSRPTGAAPACSFVQLHDPEQPDAGLRARTARTAPSRAASSST